MATFFTSVLAGLFEVYLIFSTPKALSHCLTTNGSEKLDSINSSTVHHDLLSQSEKKLGADPNVSAPAKEVPAMKLLKMVGVLSMILFLFFCTCVIPPVRLVPTMLACLSIIYFCRPRNSI